MTNNLINKAFNINHNIKHLAIIMDGNGRWAKNKGEHRIFGHQHGVKSVRECTEAAAELGIKFLTSLTN